MSRLSRRPSPTDGAFPSGDLAPASNDRPASRLQRIAERAREIAAARDAGGVCRLDDWLRAEREIDRTSANASSRAHRAPLAD
jgi:hypothetical protein